MADDAASNNLAAGDSDMDMSLTAGFHDLTVHHDEWDESIQKG